MAKIGRNETRKNGKSARANELKILLTNEENEAIRKLADEAGFSMSNLIRFRTIGPGAVISLPAKSELVKIAGEIGKIGSNINQIAAKLNSIKSDYELDAELLQKIDKVLDQRISDFKLICFEFKEQIKSMKA